MRLDIYISNENNWSRTYSKEMILKGNVSIDGNIIKKPSTFITDKNFIEIKYEDIKFVSRGGIKLQKAIQEFSIILQNKTCLDVGASTGGFTDCMLKYGAKKIYAVDTGTEQLHSSLKDNSLVISFEKTNINDITKEIIGDEFDFAAVDVSFVSLKKVLPAVKGLLKEKSSAVCLIKPQFEAGRRFLNKKGIVIDKKVHQRVLEEMHAFASSIGFKIIGTIPSPIEGGDGNIEYLMHITLG